MVNKVDSKLAVGLPLDKRGRRLAYNALEAFARKCELERAQEQIKIALSGADRVFLKAARALRYHSNR